MLIDIIELNAVACFRLCSQALVVGVSRQRWPADVSVGRLYRCRIRKNERPKNAPPNDIEPAFSLHLGAGGGVRLVELLLCLGPDLFQLCLQPSYLGIQFIEIRAGTGHHFLGAAVARARSLHA